MQAAEIEELLAYLTPDERRELDRLVAAAPIPVWIPLPGPQTLAFNSLADVVGYGGAAGGGKTDLAVGKALTQHRRVAIFRREGTQLLGVIDRITELLGTSDGYNSQKNVWRRAGPRDVQIEFGSTPNPGDEAKYQGRPKDLLVLDEAANFLEAQARFLMGWVRTTVPGQRCQTLMTFNPPTSAEGRWLLAYFAPWLSPKHPNPAAPGELRWFATIDGKDVEAPSGQPFEHDGELIQPQSRTFIPSRISDNPHLMGTGYMAQLQALPEPLRSQMLKGDFAAGMEDDAMQVIPTAWVEAAMDRWVKPLKRPLIDSLGVDVARGGKDNTTIAPRAGAWFDEARVYPGTQTPDGPSVAGLTVAANPDNAPIHIDVIGVGASPYDFLRGAGQPVYGINVSERSVGTDRSGKLRFANLRSELWWRFRELLDPANNAGAQLPDDADLLVELCAPRWRLQGPIIHVESRDDIVKRIGRSPDRASAFILALIDTPRTRHAANAAPVGSDPRDAEGRPIFGGVPVRAAREYDPYGNV